MSGFDRWCTDWQFCQAPPVHPPRETEMAPNYPEPSKITWCKALCPSSVLDRWCSVSSYLGRLSLCCLPNRTECFTNRENGPDGIRTRICDLDRVLCSRYTTGPVLS